MIPFATATPSPSNVPSSFDTDINPYLHRNKFDTQSSIISDIIGGTTATIVDAGASIWNSLPFTPEVSTEELLRNIDNDALRIYEENPDLIQAASFIGSSIIPGGAALKAMNLLRNGSRGLNWFTKAGKEASKLELDNLFRAGKAGTAEYKSKLRSFYGKGLANEMLDAVAAEAAVLGTLNAHPILEDYWKDPVENFLISAATGSVIGGTIGHVADRFALRSLTSATEQTAYENTLAKLKSINADMPAAIAVQVSKANEDTLNEIIAAGKSAGKTEENSLEMSMASKELLRTQSAKVQLFESALSPEMRAWPAEAKQALMEKVENGTQFWGVEKFRELTEGQVLGKGLSLTPKTAATTEPILTKPKFNKKTGLAEMVELESVYHPELGVFSTVKQAPLYASVASLKKSVAQLTKEMPFNYGKLPNLDADLEVITKSTAEVEAQVIGAIGKFQNMGADQLHKLVIAENDIAALTGVISKLKNDPALYQKVKVAVASDQPRVARTIAQHKSVTLTPDGRPIDYAKAIGAISPPDVFKKFALYDRESVRSLPDYAQMAIRDWVSGGGVAELRKGAVEVLGKGFGAVPREKWSAAAEKFEALRTAPQSEALRQYLRTLADADGNILLYRGWKAPTKGIRGHAQLESYALEPSKAGQFGTPHLYRVHVDDVMFGLNDIGGGSSHAEIVVAAGSRPVEAVLDKMGRANFLTTKSAEVTAANADNERFFMSDLVDKLLAAKERQINAMRAAGTPIVAIAKKTNTPIQTVEALLEGSNTLDELVMVHGMPHSTIMTMDDAAKAVAPENRSVVVSGNQAKNQYAQAKGNLDKATLDKANALSTEMFLRKSESSLAKELADLVYVDYKKPLDILRQQLGWVNNQAAGSRFWNSFDFFARNMKEVGPVASMIGKRIEAMRNKLIERVVSPISTRMSSVTKDPAAVIEFNTFRELNASLQGFRKYENRMLWQEVDTISANGKTVKQWVPVQYQGKDYKVATDSVDSLIHEIQRESKELRALTNTKRKILGQPDVNDIGLWIPSVNPVNKFIAYVHNATTGKTQMLYANTDSELASVISKYQEWVSSQPNASDIKIYTKKQQAEWSVLNDRMDSIFMERADLAMQKTGAGAAALVRANLDVFSEIAGGYEHYITAQTRHLADLSLSDITGQLERLSELNQHYYKNQPLSKVASALRQPADAAAVVRNTLLGEPSLKEYKGWQAANQVFEMTLAFGANAASRVWDSLAGPLLKPIKGLYGTAKEAALKAAGKELPAPDLSSLDYEQMVKLLDEAGVHNPFQVFDDEAAKMFGVAKLEDAKDTSKRIVYASNALAATSLLRFGDLAQPLVNMLSLPILTALTASQKMPANFMGAALKNQDISITRIMHEGIRAMNSPAFKHLDDRWAREGFYDAMVSEATNVLRASRQFEKGPIAAIENLIDKTNPATAGIEESLDRSILSIFTRPADWVEAQTRRSTMFTGYVLAKKLYPELDDTAATVFARDFLDKSIGNYHANQRPVFFQGTLGVALGLFQTYMLTLAQGMYRSLEMKNYKALGKAMLAQGGIFGAASMPGFQPISQMIGEHYSDDHFDLTTGTYRALPDKMADVILYGLPSNLGPSLYTRGDISPRPPNILGGLENTVAVSFLSQSMDMFKHLKNAIAADSPDMALAFGQALSLQSMSRPLARGAELLTGYSMTQEGNTMQIPEEVWTPMGIAARLLATRPFEETKLRQAQYLNSFYGSVDYENRQKLMAEVKTAIRNETLSDERLSEWAYEYFRNNGTPAGWRSAINEAIGRTDTEGKEHLISKLRPDSPLMHMINQME